MALKKLQPVFRIAHWLIAIPVLLNGLALEEGDAPHRYLGYLALAMVLLRLAVAKRRPAGLHYNPKAVYVYRLIWTCVIGLGITGFMMGLDRFWGDQTLEDIHEVISNVLLGLVAVHLLGVFGDALMHKRRTWMVMITGNKE